MKTFISLLAVLTAFLSFVSPGRSAFHTNIIQFSAFNPPTMTVKAGDRITWLHQDGATGHTVTGDTLDEEFCGSQFFFEGGMCIRQFDDVGTFDYHCEPHFFFMTGTVIVQPAGNTRPNVLISAPANNASITGPTNVIVRATATDSDGVVTNVAFFDGSNPLGSDASAPFEVNPFFGLGQHVLTAIATDNTGAQATSAPVTILITAPRVVNPIVDRIPKGDLSIELQIVAEAMQSPLGLAVPDDSSGRVLVYDQAGLIWVLNNGVKVSTPMLDIRNRLVLLGPYDERGLLGAAVHPNFAQFPLIYTYTSEPIAGTPDFISTATNKNHHSVIAEWRIDAGNPLRIDPLSRREVLRLDKPQSNHNGGTLRFGPDGFLYVSIGDGGNADDQGDGHVDGGNAQYLENVLGKVLRIDVNARTSPNGQYGIPAENPFVGQAGIDEIYAYGLRNPFSFSFDRANGTLYLGDVGQNAIEELDIIVSGGNYGWRVKEGTFYFEPNGAQPGYVTTMPVVPEPPNLIDPIAQYDHDDGLAIVGGYVYRGSAVGTLAGKYVTGDWGNFSVPSGRLFYLDSGNVFKEFRIGREDRPLGEWVKGFGEDAAGELYVCVGRTLGPVGTSGRVLKIVPVPDPIQITGAQAGSLSTEWTGGRGPFVLEKKDTLLDLSWNDALATANSSGSVPSEGPTGFFRVEDLANHSGIPLSVVLSGQFERPTPLNNSAIGFGTMRIEGDQLYLDLRYSGLSGVATAGHIHGPANSSTTAGVLVDLAPLNGGAWGTSGTLSGAITLTPALKAMILDGKTYINLHTVANTGGETRGPIVPVLLQSVITGQNERPTPHATPAIGQSSMFLVGTQLTFNITYKELVATATVAHIHGPAGPNGTAGVLIDLMPFHIGTPSLSGSFSGTVSLAPNVLTQVVDRLTYVNVHSTAHPGGEIRGQIIPKVTANPLTASLTGAAERPTPVTTPGTGFGSFRIDGNHLHFEVTYFSLSSTAIAAHIHGPAPASAAAGVLIDLGPYVIGSFARGGALAGRVPITPAQKALILSGQTYVNIHTINNGGGEIRGQLVNVLFSSSLNGNNERPNSIVTPGFGSSTLLLVGNRLWFDVTYRNLTGTAADAHIHGPATQFGTASVLVGLGPFNGGAFGPSGSLAGVITLSPNNLGSLTDGLTYLNVHTVANSAGEIRGQILR